MAFESNKAWGLGLIGHLTMVLQWCTEVLSVTVYFYAIIAVFVAKVTRLNQTIFTKPFTTLNESTIDPVSI